MNIAVVRDGGLGDIITILYFCNYHYHSGHNITFIAHKRFHNFLLSQKCISSVKESFNDKDFDLVLNFQAIEHELKNNNNHKYKFKNKYNNKNCLNAEGLPDVTNTPLREIFYNYANSFLKTEPLFFEIKVPDYIDKQVKEYFKNFKKPIICVNHIATAFNRTLNIDEINGLFINNQLGTLVNISSEYFISKQNNAFEIFDKNFHFLSSLIKNCDILFTCNTGSLHIGNNYFKHVITFDTSWPIKEYNILQNPNLHILNPSNKCTNCRLHTGCWLDENVLKTTYNKDFNKEKTPICCYFDHNLVIEKLKKIYNIIK